MSAAAKASGANYVIAIAGATGNVGTDIASIIPKVYPSVFSRVVALVRDPSSASAQALGAQGTELHTVSPSNAPPDLLTALEGVDVLVDTLPPWTAYKGALAEAAVERGVKVLFASEYSAHRRGDPEYRGWAHLDWVDKDAFAAHAQALAPGTQTKVVQLYVGLFLEMLFSTFLGFDHANDLYTIYGSPSQRATFTSLGDVNRAIVELSLRALNPATASTVSEHVHIAGDTLTF